MEKDQSLIDLFVPTPTSSYPHDFAASDRHNGRIMVVAGAKTLLLRACRALLHDNGRWMESYVRSTLAHFAVECSSSLGCVPGNFGA